MTIGVIVPIQSLLDYDNTPGDLLDRTNTVPASVIRDLAGQVGTVFYRLLTDEAGRLLDVTQIGKHPKPLMRYALAARSGTCRWPIGSTPATECDLDHHSPWPRGKTEAANLGPLARRAHRGKTHAGFTPRRTNGDTTQWTTPTGHTYTVGDDPLPVGSWLTDPDPPIDWPPEFYQPDDWLTESDLISS